MGKWNDGDVLVFIDLATRELEVVATDYEGNEVLTRRVDNLARPLGGLVERLAREAGGVPGQVKVGLESCRDFVVDLLHARGCSVYVVDPRQVEEFRRFRFASSAKSDERDCRTGVEALRLHPEAFRVVKRPDATTEAIRALARARAQVVEKAVAVGNQLTSFLTLHCPLDGSLS